MYSTRLLVLTLICAVTLRDDVALLPGSIACASTATPSKGSVSPREHDEEWNDEGDDETDGPDAYPDHEPIPAENQELPGILEFELDSEVEEMFFVDRKLHPGSIVQQFSIETDRFLSNYLTSHSPLICLRI